MRHTGRLLGGIMLAAAVGGFGLVTVRRMRASRERLETLRRRAETAARRDARLSTVAPTAATAVVSAGQPAHTATMH